MLGHEDGAAPVRKLVDVRALGNILPGHAAIGGQPGAGAVRGGSFEAGSEYFGEELGRRFLGGYFGGRGTVP